MSAWTQFRDQITTGLGIRTPEAAAKTLGNLTAAEIEKGKRGANPDTYIVPASSEASVRSEGAGFSSAQIAGVSVGTLAAVGLAAYFIFKKR